MEMEMEMEHTKYGNSRATMFLESQISSNHSFELILNLQC
jgi:hypothetical protein